MNNNDERDYAEEEANRRLMEEEDCDCNNLYLCSHSSFVTNPPGTEEAVNADICPDCDNEGCVECDPLELTPEEEDYFLPPHSDGYGNTYPSYDAQMYYSEG